MRSSTQRYGRWATGIVVLCALGRAAEGAPWRDLRIQIDVEPLEKRAPPAELRSVFRRLPAFSDDVMAQKELPMKFCVEPSGRIVDVKLELPGGISNGEEENIKILGIIEQWSFAPIAARTCFKARWIFTAGDNPGDAKAEAPRKIKTIAHELDPSEVLYKVDPSLPPQARKGRGEKVFFAKICVGRDGRVFRVEVLQGIPGADEEMKNTILQWRYKPQPVDICFPSRWIFSALIVN
jgi:hypothetical protein